MGDLIFIPRKPSIITRRGLLTGVGALATAAALPKPVRAIGSSQWPPQGSPILGNVGGTANVWQAADQTLTRPANTTAYAANEALGSSASVIFSFGDLVNYPSSVPFFRHMNSSAILTGLRLTASLAGGISGLVMGSVLAHMFQAAPSAATTGPLTDQGVWQMLQADSTIKLGIVLFSAWYTGGTGSDITESYGAPVISQQPIIAAPTTQSLFVVCTAQSAFTPLSAMIYHLHAASVGD
jgi:hypothetical protein